jgi:hypothetical protein
MGGIGAPSFASKHLRFLRPDVCPILDSVIAGNLTYASTSAGYAQYAADCLEIARVLENNGVPNPVLRSDRWRAADVDMALYAALQGWK